MITISLARKKFPKQWDLPSVYSRGLSQASSHASTWIHRLCCSEYTSVQTRSSRFHTHLTRPPTARQSMLKQLAHSPTRPLLDCSSAHTSPYRGNLSSALQSVFEQRYDSTLAAPRAVSSGVGGANPLALVGDPQTVQGGLLTN